MSEATFAGFRSPRPPDAPALRRLVLGLALLGGWLVRPAAATERPNETEVKAALLYNFTQFVEWPASAFARPDAPLVLGLVGRDGVTTALASLVDRERVGRHPLEVRTVRTVAEAEACHVLFVSGPERERGAEMLTALAGRPILTVADFDGFLRAGGIVRLYCSPERKVRVRVNLEGARAAGLNLSSKLLRVVEIVPPEEE